MKPGMKFVRGVLAEKAAKLVEEQRATALVKAFGSFPKVISEGVSLPKKARITEAKLNCGADGCDVDDDMVYWQDGDDWYEADADDVILYEKNKYKLKEGKKARKLVGGKGKKVRMNESGKFEVVKSNPAAFGTGFLGESLLKTRTGRVIAEQLKAKRNVTKG